MRSSLAELSTPELVARREELGPLAHGEARDQQEIDYLQGRIASEVEFLGKLRDQRERLSSLPRRQRRPESERIQLDDARTRNSLARKEAEARQLGEVKHQARAELAVVEHLISERERLAFAAVRLSPPSYIVAELGARPNDPDRRMAWDRTAVGIENYRRRYGIRGRDSALGDRPEERMQRVAWEHRQQDLERTQRQLGRARTVERDMGLEIGL